MLSRATAALGTFWQGLGTVWQTIRPRLPSALLSSVVFCAPILVMFWGFDVTDDLQARIVVSFLAAVVPVLELMSQPRPLRCRWELFVFGLFLALALLLLMGDRFQWSALGINAAMLLIVVPYFPFIWLLMGPRWPLFSCALLSGLAVMLVYWFKAMADSDAPLELLLTPVPAFLIFGLVWAPIARFALSWARRCRNRPMAGPGTQTLAMVALFLPVILVAVFGPVMLDLSGIWSAASLTIVSVLLSAVVSQPLYRFLVFWARL